jgi:hypothetical protein
MAVSKKLLFIDTNIWLDFYRPRQSDVALDLLERLERMSDKIIVTHILEMEYKNNRQSAILEGMRELKMPQMPQTLGIFSEAKASKMIEKRRDEIEKRLKRLRGRLERALTDPQQHDPVYQTCQRIFGRDDKKLTFSIDSDRRLKRVIREKAMRRFVLGCPPRKADDISIGDAINWEWMVRCAEQHQAELVILTRDSDYGPQFGKDILLNDHLKQEFKERVSKKRDVLVYKSASLALKHFHVAVPEKVVKGELEFISSTSPSVTKTVNPLAGRQRLREWLRELDQPAQRQADADPLDWLRIDDDEPTSTASADEFEDLDEKDDEGQKDKG